MYKFTQLLIVIVFLWSNLSVAKQTPIEPKQQFANFKQCNLINGKTIAPCQIGFRTFGSLNADKSNAILVPTWFAGNSAGHAYLASNQFLNPKKYFIIVVDAFANGISSSPSNSKTQPNEKFPQISITDMVISQHKLLTEILDIQSLHAVVGLSMGGMQAFEWAVRYPNFMHKTVAAIASPRLPVFDIALWNTRNQLLALYRECLCKEALEVMKGLRMLMQVPTKLSKGLAREETVSKINSSAKSNKLSVPTSWDMQRQAEAMMVHNIAQDYNNDLQKAAAHIKSKFLIVVSEDDRIVTPQPARDFAKLIDTRFIELDQDCGHAAPWCEEEVFAEAVKSFIEKN